jgi:hypothetical protein
MDKLPTLKEALASSTLVDLKAIAQTRKIAYGGTALKDDLVAWLNWALGQPSAVHAAVSSCTKVERDALITLVAAGGLMPAHVFVSRFGSVRRPESQVPAGVSSQRPWLPAAPTAGAGPSPVGASATEGLWYKGLVFRAHGLGVPSYSESIFIPGDLLPLMPTAEPQPPISVETVAAPQQAVGNDTLTRDVLAFVSFLRRESVTPVRGYALSKRHLVSLSGQLAWQEDVAGASMEEEAGYIFFLHCLLSALKLVSGQDRRLLPTAKVASWLGQTAYQQLFDMWEKYQRLTTWNEFTRLGLAYSTAAVQIVDCRRHLLEGLRRCPAGQWLSLSSFIRKVYQDDPYMMRPQEYQRTWPVRDDSGKALGSWEAWERIEGRFIRATLADPLTWLGLVDRDSATTIFRITPLGAALLGLAPCWTEEPAPRPMVVHASFEVLVPLEACSAHVYRLDDFAEVVKRDRATIYSITKESVRRSMENGDSGDKIVGFLETASGRELPQNVAYSLREWAGKYGEIGIRRATVVTTTSAALMQEVRGIRKLKLPVEEELGPQAVTIPDETAGDLVTRLKKAGYFPRLSQGAADGRREDTAHEARLTDADLVPLLAAARLVEGRGFGPRFPSGLLDRLEQLVGPANQAASRRLAAEMQEMKPVASPPGSAAPQPAVRFATTFTVPRLEDAIRQRMTVDLEYYDDSRSEIVQRRVDPYRLESKGGVVCLAGFCHLCQEERSFLVDHVRSVTLTDVPFPDRRSGV